MRHTRQPSIPIDRLSRALWRPEPQRPLEQQPGFLGAMASGVTFKESPEGGGGEGLHRTGSQGFGSGLRR